MIALFAALSMTLHGAPGTVITVGNESFSAKDIAARAAEFRPRTPSAQEVVDSLVVEALFAQDARRSGTASAPEAKTAVEGARATVLADAYLEPRIARQVEAHRRAGQVPLPQGRRQAPPLTRGPGYEGGDPGSAGAAAAGRRPRGRSGPFAPPVRRPEAATPGSSSGTPSRIRSATTPSRRRPAPGRPIALKNGWAVAKVVEQVVADEKTLRRSARSSSPSSGATWPTSRSVTSSPWPARPGR